MATWVPVTAAAMAAFVLWIAWGRHWLRSVWYSWVRAAHVIGLTEQEPVPAPEYGSMILAEERGLHGPEASTTFLPAPPPELAHEPDWREQTAADLSPEALNDQPDPYLDALAAEYGSEFDDSGPGDLSSLTPGPGQMSESDWTAPPVAKPWPEDTGASAGRGGMATAVPAPAPAPSRLADTGDIASAHLLADVQAFMRAQDDEARAYSSANELGWHDFIQQYWLDFAAVLA